MNSSTRLYERLGQIPQDPEDPESLDDLIVCAFGAFERYYVCWRNKAGDHRQDGYDLPPALSEWLWPTDGTTRDFPSLQVVFGRGDEYFASDKDGKLEYKEPEKPPPPPEELGDKPSLRRTRTMSVFKSAADATTNLFNTSPDVSSPSRRSSGASQSTSRPPSMSFSAKSLSEASLSSRPNSRSPSLSSLRSTADSTYSTATTIPSRPSSDADVKPIDTTEPAPEEAKLESPTFTPVRLTRRLRPLSMSFKPSSFPKISEGRELPQATPSESMPPMLAPQQLSVPASTDLPLPKPVSSQSAEIAPSPPPSQTPNSASCTCGCHAEPLPPPQPKPRPSYADASMQTDPLPSYAEISIQTDPLPSPPRTALRLDTTPSIAAVPEFSYTASAHDSEATFDDFYQDEAPAANPFPMGRMSAFFQRPGYKLGDSLASAYEQADIYEEEEVYESEYEENYEDEDDGWAAWEAANGKW